jgi:hypothetical protein
MADETENQIPDTPNLADSTAEAEVRKQFRRTKAERARVAAAAQGAITRGMVGDPRGAVGGAVGGGGGDPPANPRGEDEGILHSGDRGEYTQMRGQIEVLMTAVRALTTAQGAGGMGPSHGKAPPEAPVDKGVQMAQNTQELSLTTPVLFYGKCKDGKSIPPNAFLMELEARQTRHRWKPSMLLGFVKSCLRGEAALRWEGCILFPRG